MPNTYSNNTWLKLLTLVFGLSLLWACSGGGNNNLSISEDLVDSEYPDYTVVTLEAGDDSGSQDSGGPD